MRCFSIQQFRGCSLTSIAKSSAIEVQLAGDFGARLWRDSVPEYVQLQVQHQLAVTGKPTADVVAALLCGQKLEVHRISEKSADSRSAFLIATEPLVDPASSAGHAGSSARALPR
jgi:predicted phage-related endonuclease